MGNLSVLSPGKWILDIFGKHIFDICWNFANKIRFSIFQAFEFKHSSKFWHLRRQIEKVKSERSLQIFVNKNSFNVL